VQGLHIGENITLEGVVGDFETSVDLAITATSLSIVSLHKISIFKPVHYVAGTSETCYDTV